MQEEEKRIREDIKKLNNDYGALSIWKLIKLDSEKYGGLFRAFFSKGFHVSVQYRIAHMLQKKRLTIIAHLYEKFFWLFSSVRICRKAVIGPGLVINHPEGIFIAPYVSLGRDCNIGAHSFISSNYGFDDPDDYPVISNGVSVAVGAVIMGGIAIEEGVIIGPNVVVMKSIKAFHNAMPNPVRQYPRIKDGWLKSNN